MSFQNQRTFRGFFVYLSGMLDVVFSLFLFLIREPLKFTQTVLELQFKFICIIIRKPFRHVHNKY